MVNEGRGFFPSSGVRRGVAEPFGVAVKLPIPVRAESPIYSSASRRRGRSRSRRATLALGAAGLLVVAALIGLAYSGSRQELAEGTRVAGVDVGGLSRGPQWRGSTSGSARWPRRPRRSRPETGVRACRESARGRARLASCGRRGRARRGRLRPDPRAPPTAHAVLRRRGASSTRGLELGARVRPRRDRDASRSHSSKRRARAARLAVETVPEELPEPGSSGMPPPRSSFERWDDSTASGVPVASPSLSPPRP